MECIRNLCRKKRPTGVTYDDNLETEEEYQERWTSVRIIYFTMFLMSLGFSIVLTGIWPYLDKMDKTAGKEFMGYIVGANPLGQMLFSPLVGYWGNKRNSIRVPLLFSLGLFTLSSAVYSSLEIFPSHAKWWMLGSRFFVGVSSANIAVCRSYLSAATRLKERTGAVSMVSLAQVLGFVVGPGLQAAVTPLGDKGIPLIKGVLSMNMYTAAGWINVLMGICNFCMFLPAVFKERRIAAREVMVLQGMESEKETYAANKPDYLSAWTLITAFFVLVFNFVLLETLGTSLTMDQFAWSKTEALYYMGIMMSVGAVIACVTFVGIGPLCKMFDERRVLLWGGFFLMVIGRALYIPWGPDPPKMAELVPPPTTNALIPLVAYANHTNLSTVITSEDPLLIKNISFPLANYTEMTSPVEVSFNETLINATITEELLGCPPSQEWCRTIPALTITQLLLGYALTSIGYPIGVTLIQTIFSKILGPRPQGVWMGIMTGAGCLSRVMGPVFVGYIYTRMGTNVTFGVTTIMMAVSMIWLWLFRERLVPPDFEKTPIEMEEMRKIKVDIKDPNLDGVNECDKLTTNGKV